MTPVQLQGFFYEFLLICNNLLKSDSVAIILNKFFCLPICGLALVELNL